MYLLYVEHALLFQMFTINIRNLLEGDVFSHVCLFTFGHFGSGLFATGGGWSSTKRFVSDIAFASNFALCGQTLDFLSGYAKSRESRGCRFNI